MIEELRAFPAGPAGPFRVGVSAGAGPLPEWKRAADFVFAQVRFSLDEMLEWRAGIDFAGPVYAGVIVVPSVAMGRKIGADIKELTVPDTHGSRRSSVTRMRVWTLRATWWRRCGNRARTTACTSYP
jgi:hypothetical protein